jgi:hypothetical protein
MTRDQAHTSDFRHGEDGNGSDTSPTPSTGEASGPSCSRRTALRGGLGALAAVASAGASGCITTLIRRKRRRQQGSVPAAPPISFASQRKRIRKKDADQIVSTPNQLIQAAKQPNTTIWIPGKAILDMTGHSNIKIAPNVRVASNRHLGGGKGALIRFDDYEYLFTVPQRGARVTGVRLRGPYTKYRNFSTEKATYAHAAYGIWFKGTSGIVDNCELWGWPAYAIGAGTSDTATQMWIHHNEIHHNQLGGLGYALESLNGMSLVEWNYFSHYRHVVSGYGYKTNGYEFRCNVVGPPGNADPARFPCDMHSLGEQDNFPNHITTAGKYINAHHNVFELTEENAMSISGIPTKYARFVNNWTAHSKNGDGEGEPAVYVPDGATLRMHDNHFGEDSLEPGRQWLKKMNTKIPISNGIPSPSAWSPSRSGNTNNGNSTNNSNATATPAGSGPPQRLQTPPPGERPVTEVA